MQQIHPIHAPTDDRQGVVTRKSLGQYAVQTKHGTVPCTLSSKLRKQLVYPIADLGSLRHRVRAVTDIHAVDPVAVGDRVTIDSDGHECGVIVQVLPRRNHLLRRAAGKKPLFQVVVANFDQLVVMVAAAHPSPYWEMVDRYLAAAEQAGVPALLVVTKIDLINTADLAQDVALYRRLGYPVALTSASTGAGIAELRVALRARMNVFAGVSGVGKTTLLNALQPNLGARVGAVSARKNEGKHTTSQLERFALTGGGSIVDTPGMREFALWDVDELEVAQLFPELRAYVGHCRFGLDCSHTHEPDCAIQRGIVEGDITPRRYRSFIRLTT